MRRSTIFTLLSLGVGALLATNVSTASAEERDNSSRARIQRASETFQKLKAVPLPQGMKATKTQDEKTSGESLRRRGREARSVRSDSPPRRDTQLRTVRATKKRLDTLKKRSRQQKLDYQWKVARALVGLEVASSEQDKSRARELLSRVLELKERQDALEEAQTKNARDAFETARKEYRQKTTREGGR